MLYFLIYCTRIKHRTWAVPSTIYFGDNQDLCDRRFFFCQGKSLGWSTHLGAVSQKVNLNTHKISHNKKKKTNFFDLKLQKNIIKRKWWGILLRTIEVNAWSECPQYFPTGCYLTGTRVQWAAMVHTESQAGVCWTPSFIAPHNIADSANTHTAPGWPHQV